MGPADTYQLTRLNNEGFSVDDVHYVDSEGKRSVLYFNKVGQVIDLALVDVKRFVTSAVRGTLKELVDTGALRTVQADISEKRHDELTAAYEEIKPYNFRQGFNVQARSIELEPGMGVAVGGENRAPHNMSQTIEPGAVAPANQVQDKVAPGVPLEDVPAQDGETGIKEPAPAENNEATGGADLDAVDKKDEGPQIADWKASKNQKQIENYVKKSKDKEFLQSLIDDDKETAKLKTLAKRTLAKLE